MPEEYDRLKRELAGELERILSYWCKHSPDHQYGGFHGRINHYNEVIEKAPKGIILNTRILWSFAAAYNHLKIDRYKFLANRAYDYLTDYFTDREDGGVYWEVTHTGKPINTRKQIYAQAFAIYALSEYYTASGNEDALKLAIRIFELIEEKAKDEEKGGYLEAFSVDWKLLEDMRLSEKDLNSSKTMNTHLHVLEAYTRLYRIYPDATLRKSLSTLVRLFLNTFLDQTNHIQLFFDSDWNRESHVVSFGHDIEAIWLISEAAELLNEQTLRDQSREVSISIADTFLAEALDGDGAVMNEKDQYSGKLDTDRHWWPQVEALIGLDHAYQLTRDLKYLEASLKIWDFTKKHLIDHKHGEWHFRVDDQGKPYEEEDKVSMWKAPYHTSRACIKLNSQP